MADDCLGGGIAHHEPLEDKVFPGVVHQVGVFECVLCDHTQQIEIGDASIRMCIHFFLNDVEEEAHVAVIANKLIDNPHPKLLRKFAVAQFCESCAGCPPTILSGTDCATACWRHLREIVELLTPRGRAKWPPGP